MIFDIEYPDVKNKSLKLYEEINKEKIPITKESDDKQEPCDLSNRRAKLNNFDSQDTSPYIIRKKSMFEELVK